MRLMYEKHITFFTFNGMLNSLPKLEYDIIFSFFTKVIKERRKKSKTSRFPA